MADPIVLKWDEEGLPALVLKVERLNRKLEESSEETEKLDRTTKSLSKQARQTARTMSAFGDALSGVSSGAGRMTRTGGRLLGVFSRVSASGGAAGLAIAGTAAALFGAAGAAVQAGEALLDTAANGRALAQELQPFTDAGFFAALGDETIDSFDRTNDAFEALRVTSKGLALVFTAELLPNIEGLAVGTVAVGLAVSDTAGRFGDLLRSATDFATGLDELIERQGVFGRLLLGVGTGGLTEAIVAVGNYADGIGEAGTESASYIEQAQALIDQVGQAGKSFDKSAGAARNFGAAVKELTPEEKQAEAITNLIDLVGQLDAAFESPADAALRKFSEKLDKIAELEAASQDYYLGERARAAAQLEYDQTIAAIEDEAAERRRAQDKAFSDQVALDAKMRRDAQINAAADTLDAVSSLAGTMSDVLAREGSKGAIALFRVNQAAALANIGVLTAQAIMAALAQPVGGRVLAIAAGATGAAQAAVVAAQQPPQVEQAHMGAGLSGAGQMVGSPSMAPDERTSPGGRRTLDQEATISSTGVNAIVNALNAARSPGGGLRTVRAVVGRGHLDRENERSLRGGTSRFARQNKRGSLAAVRAKNREP